MKTNPTLKPITILAVTLSAVFVVQLVNAQAAPQFAAAPTHNIAFEETSDTTMTATYDNNPVMVTFLGANRWNVTFASASFSSSAAGAWVEPENSALFNFVGTAPGVSNILIINSDVASSAATFQDEASSSPTSFGTDTRDGGQIFVTFDDDGDVATTPDTGSTLGLLALALAALFGARRLRSLRLA